MRNYRFFATLGDGREIIQIFHQLFIIRDWKHNGSFFARFVGEILNGFAHASKITSQRAFVEGTPAGCQGARRSMVQVSLG